MTPKPIHQHHRLQRFLRWMHHRFLHDPRSQWSMLTQKLSHYHQHQRFHRDHLMQRLRFHLRRLGQCSLRSLSLPRHLRHQFHRLLNCLVHHLSRLNLQFRLRHQLLFRLHQ